MAEGLFGAAVISGSHSTRCCLAWNWPVQPCHEVLARRLRRRGRGYGYRSRNRRGCIGWCGRRLVQDGFRVLRGVGRIAHSHHRQGSVANIFDGCEEDFLRFVHAGLALKFCSSIATTSVSALGPMLKARSTMRASPRMSPVKLKIAAWPLRRARMTSKPLIVA